MAAPTMLVTASATEKNCATYELSESLIMGAHVRYQRSNDKVVIRL